MKYKLRQLVIVVMVAAFLLPLISFALPQKAYAAQDNPAVQLERWMYYRGMRACLEDPDFDKWVYGSDNRTMSKSDLNSKGIEEFNRKEGFGYLAKDLDDLDGKDGTVQCNGDPSGNFWKKGAQIFGFGSVSDLVCAMNQAASHKDINDGNRIKPKPNVSPCVDNATEFELDGGGGSVWQRMLTKALEDPIASEYGGDGDRPSFNFNDNNGDGYTYKSLLYLLGKNSLETFCGGSLDSAQADDQYDGSDQAVSVYIVGSDGKIKRSGIGGDGYSHTYVITKKNNESDNVNDVYFSNGGNSNEASDRSCADMARWTREGAADYAAWLEKNQDVADDTPDGGSAGTTEPTCQSEGGPAAWFLCEILEIMDRFVAFLDRQINSLLFINSDVYDNITISTAWGTMRNLALLILVPMMMFMVIGTAIGFGPFDPYTVKKALPRMFVAVIFISISLPITQFGVQVSNALGQGLGNIIISASPNDVRYISDIFSSGGGATQETLGWGAIVAGLAAFAIAGIGALLSFGLVAIAALLIGFIILVMRQVLLIALMVVAPLAILVWIFPGNDKLWGIWKGTFIAMLLMYPIVSVLLATGKFVAGILG